MIKIQNFKKTFFILLFLFSICYFLFSISTMALAQDWNQGLNQFQTQTGLGNQDLPTVVGKIVNIVLGFLGLIAVIIIVIGGFIWMTSGGAPDKIEKAKALIKAGVIGMIIIVLSFAAATFVMSLLKKVGGVEGDFNGQACDPPGVCSGCYRCGSDNIWRFDNTCDTCSSNPDSFIINTIQPEPEGVVTIRNSVVRIYFNHSVNINTLSANTVTIEQSIGGIFSPANGDLSLEGDSIVKFTPTTNCPVPNQDRKCFAANGTFRATISTQLQSTYNNLFLNCGNNKCIRNFRTNDIVDTQAPQINIINILPSQGIYVPQSATVLVTAQATDDSGISQVKFYLDAETTPRAIVTQKDLGTPDRYSFTLNTMNLALNFSHIIKAIAFDLDENQNKTERNITIRADHCFNNTKDGDETGVDCGGADCQTCSSVLSVCGNDILEANEECDTTKLNNKTCSLVDSKYISGTLACTANCAFDVSGCVEAGAVGGAGDICKISGNATCSTGATTCQNTPGLTTYSCLLANNDCRCCCNPANPISCPNSLTCTADKSPCAGSTRGLCCGCLDDSQCGGTNICDTTDSCCHNLPAPFNLTFVSQPDQIQINWNYAKDSFKYVTTFQIERAEKTSGICGSYLKIVEDKNCSQSVPTANYSCSYIDRGNFAGKQWCYRVRAKHGTNTVYSEYSAGVTENISSTVGCANNNSCTGTAACCRLDTKQCVTWDLCEGQCSVGGACQVPLILYAEADFEVTSGAIGACLISAINTQVGSPNLNQSRGYWLDSIKSVGKRFGATQASSNLVFSAQGGPVSGGESPVSGWSDNLINAQVPASSNFGDNRVVVKKTGLPDSNPVSFTVLKNEVGPGQACHENSCPLNPGVCWNPPEGDSNSLFSCRSNTTDTTTDCYCCCDPDASPDKCKSINARLSCKVGQTPCIGDTRGLCCGCQKDSDCGLTLGCGMKEPEPKCCYLRPIWENTYFCKTEDLTIDTDDDVVPLNTAITLAFSQKMDFNTLNNDNIKISYDGSCQSPEDGEVINGRCYIPGTIINYDIDSKTISSFAPMTCRLKAGTKYQIEIVVGDNGGGIISEKGVAISTTLISSLCSWATTQKKFCQTYIFTTSTDVNKLCNIESIDVQPRSETVRDIGISVNYSACARDSAGRALCVNDFGWSSDNTSVATVVASVDPKIGVATSVSKGDAKIIATIPTVNKTCSTTDTCGILKVDLGGPRVIEKQDCSDCSLGGQSPSPWKSSSDACVNALIAARFDRVMDATTLNSSNIQLFACTGTLENPECSGANLLPVDISVTSDKFYLQLLDIDTPEPHKPKALEPNTIYKVALTSGDDGIKDSNGYQLDGNRNNLSDGTPIDDYVWYFKTKSGTDPCLLNKVCVNPQQAQITPPPNPPSTQEFEGKAITANCNYLNANQFSWTWEKVKIEPWDPDKVCSLSSIGPQAATTASPLNPLVIASPLTPPGLGELYIKATAQNKSDQAHLIVATQPLFEYKPETETSCLNQIISVEFDQIMNQDSINNSTFRVDYYCGADREEPREMLNLNNLKNIFVNFWKSLFPKAKAGIISPWRPWPPAPQWCAIKGNIRTTVSEGKTTISFIPANILQAGQKYQVTISDILSRYGFSVNYQWIFKATDDAQICRLSKIEVRTNPSVDPPILVIEKQAGQYLITKTGNYTFSARAKTAIGEEIYPVPGYEWSWEWSTNNQDVVGILCNSYAVSSTCGANTGCYWDESKNPECQPKPTINKAEITIKNKNGTADLTAMAQFIAPDTGGISGVANLEVFLCENPWTYSSNDDLVNADQTHYELKYCRDASPALLPNLAVSTAGKIGANMLQNLIFMAKKDNVQTGDIVGLQVYKNPDHLTPIDWYNKLVSNPGSPSSVLVDGYVSAKEGRTIYVGAVNKNNANKLNTNIYLLSYNDGASSETLKIYNQLVANWKFNINIYFSPEQKASLQRDLFRLYDINDMAKSLEIYKNNNGFFPKLESGSYISGLSTSRWPSWQQTLGQELGESLSVDPLNQFKTGVCADCLASTQCSGTCYNPDQKKYECALGSNIYQYQLRENGQRARIYANFEYANFNYTSINSWDHSCDSYTTDSVCATHRWCYWDKVGAACQPKIMNYNFKEPCVSPSTCACFNTVYTLKTDPTMAEDPSEDPLPNSVPVASNVIITGISKVGQTLTGNYTYSDADNDAQGISTFRWLTNKNPSNLQQINGDYYVISGATSQTYTLVSADSGATITFEVTPKAAAGSTPGTAVKSIGTLINSVPVASSVTITGSSCVGQTLTGDYTYFDIDGDVDVSTFRWLKNNVAIANATSKTYTSVSADIGATITFEVTPKAATGSTPGVAVKSVGKVIAGPPCAVEY